MQATWTGLMLAHRRFDDKPHDVERLRARYIYSARRRHRQHTPFPLDASQFCRPSDPNFPIPYLYSSLVVLSLINKKVDRQRQKLAC